MAQYVKFLRGTAEAYKNCQKNSDTLYFVTEQDENIGKLYLGEKLLSGSTDLGESSIGAFKDVLLSENIANDSLLVYDSVEGAWVNRTIDDQFPIFGAINSAIPGLVPGAPEGESNLFLKSDGTWAAIEIPNVEVKYDEKVFTSNVDEALTLLGFDEAEEGAQFIKTNGQASWVKPNTDTVEGLGTTVAALEKTVETLGTTVEGLGEEITSLQTTTETLNTDVGELKTKTETLETDVGGLKTTTETLSSDLETLADNTYTKEETDLAIAAGVAGAAHLKRKIFASEEEAQQYVTENDDFAQYIYMIPTGLLYDPNKYDEYLAVEVTVDEVTSRVLEPVGSWEVNLDDYAKKEEVEDVQNALNTFKDSLGFEISEDKTVAEAIDETYAKKNDFIITQVEPTEFTLVDKKLGINKIAIEKVDGLFTALENKVDKVEDKELIETALISKVKNLLNITKTSEDFIVENDELKFSATFDERISNIENAVAWGAIE